MGRSLPGDVEGSSVIDGCADQGKSEGDIDCAIEGQGLEGDVSLVVIHADESVGRFASFREEGGIGGQRTVDVDSASLGRFDFGNDDALFFAITEQAVLSGVRIESKSEQARRAILELAQSVVGQIDYFAQPFPEIGRASCRERV